METVLTEKPKLVTRRRLLQFFIFIMSFVIILIGYVVLLNQMIVQEYDRMGEQLIQLNTFFQDISKSEKLLNQYIYSSDEADFVFLEQLNTKSLKEAENLRNLEIAQRHLRTITDIQIMMDSYIDKAQNIHEYIKQYRQEPLESKWVSLYSKEYTQVKEILSFINDERNDLFDSALAYMTDTHNQIKTQMNQHLVSLFIVIFVLLVLGTEQALKLVRSITNPIWLLTKGAQKIANGSLEQIRPLSVGLNTEDEISFLISVFNTMLLRISQQVNQLHESAKVKEALLKQELENLKVKASLKASELKRLQIQINSHFLFNTLGMISQTAYMENADETVILLENTAQFLRYSLDFSDKTVSLARELEELGNYIFLQEQRFGKRISFLFQLDEQFHQIKIPSLILQPIVENAIVHGLGMCRKGGEITVTTSYNHHLEQGMIRISDNGIGMSKEQLSHVKSSLMDTISQETHIGLPNIYMRLQLCFQNQAQMKIDSTFQVGTSVCLILPYKMEND